MSGLLISLIVIFIAGITAVGVSHLKDKYED